MSGRVEALDLLEAQMCTPSCLLAMSSYIEDCTCRCGGRWHGVLLYAQADEWAGPSLTDERGAA